MKPSISYLKEALEKMGSITDTEKAKKLRIANSTLSLYLSEERKMDNFSCIMVGNYLGIDPMAIIAACEEERAKSEEKQGFWRDFRSTLGTTTVAALVFGNLMTMTPSTALAATVEQGKPAMTNVYYVK